MYAGDILLRLSKELRVEVRDADDSIPFQGTYRGKEHPEERRDENYSIIYQE